MQSFIRPEGKNGALELVKSNRNTHSPGTKGCRGEGVLSDEELFEAIKQGDGDALSALYDRHALMVHRIANRLIEDDRTVQEVVQDVFTRLWTTSARYPSYGSFDQWLCAITRRIAIDHLRREKRHADVPLPNIEIHGDRPIAYEATELAVDRRLLKEELLHAIANLHEDQRVILHRAYFQGYTLTEIATSLQVPIGTVKTRLHQGLKNLRAIMETWGEEAETSGQHR